MALTQHTRERLERQVEGLCRSFDRSLDKFGEKMIFTGPSLHFHARAVEVRRQAGSAMAASRSTAFCELVYATLASWGMHRMGPAPVKLTDFDVFAAAIRSAGERLDDLEGLRLGHLSTHEAEDVAARLWDVMSSLEFGVSDSKLVSGTKAVHHLLPDLVPPMDRRYTVRFFFGYDGPSGGEGSRFVEMLVRFNEVARCCDDRIELRLGKGMHTSRSKVLDNAVVGYMLMHKKREPGGTGG